MSPFIPRDLLIKIFARFPAKSLLRFMSLSKSWHSLITSTNFICMHAQIASRSEKKYILLGRYLEPHGEQYWLRYQETFDEYGELEFPFKSYIPGAACNIIGYCNGLLCLNIDFNFARKDIIILWNPSIKKSLTLPLPSIPYSLPMDRREEFYHVVLGIGLDPKNNDIKVIRIIYPVGYHIDSPTVEIYGLSIGAWRPINVAPCTQHVIDNYQSQVSIHEAIHWIASKKIGRNNFDNSIVLFDMRNEIFRQIMLPESLASEQTGNLSVALLGDTICMMQYNSFSPNGGWVLGDRCCIWVMKEYGVMTSWTKQLTFDLQICQALGLRKNGELLLMCYGDEGLGLYDHEIKKTSYLGINGLTFFVDDYTESLVLLKGDNGLLEGAPGFIREEAVLTHLRTKKSQASDDMIPFILP